MLGLYSIRPSQTDHSQFLYIYDNAACTNIAIWGKRYDIADAVGVVLHPNEST